MSAIRTEKLSKHYGRRRGVVELDLEVKPGEVFGFLGPNGAGKTTTIRLLLDLIRPSGGQAWVLGQPVRDNPALRRRVGYLPGELNLYDGLTGWELLRYFGRLRGKLDAAYLNGLLERLALDPTRKLRTLSKGNKQKIGLVQAFMHRPELLILDEPTSGLDPLLQAEFQKLVQEVRREGATVFLSSHVMGEVQALCDRVGIIREGRLVAVSAIHELAERSLRRVRIRFAEAINPKEWAQVPGLKDLRAEGDWLEATVQGSLDPLIKAAAQHRVRDFISQEPSLEEIFLAYYDARSAA
ncbi:ABC transporter ATP-binding protein NatA [Calidithermus terrae]|uniref:ABC transporter ATP-binding protein NatA n=1 Tax=Calidithermus terrae TaxID=1408545 RepID=A0A399EFQ1_9DEIN|nr:ABC transporter ATP-binding protein [Calidithermus terrae]RIH82566.1 ABC transporter ATP-binding protein NatA [Calidithermus terrae]